MFTNKPEKSPLARLVSFTICLAIFGTIIAGAYGFVISLDQQENLQQPENIGLCTQISCLPKEGPMGGPDRCDSFCPNNYPPNMFEECINECYAYMAS